MQAVRSRLADPCEGGEGYVMACKDALAGAATAVSGGRPDTLRAGFNRALTCAEIAGKQGVARAVVHGECGTPSTAYVFADRLDQDAKHALAAAFGGLSVIFLNHGDRIYPGGRCCPARRICAGGGKEKFGRQT